MLNVTLEVQTMRRLRVWFQSIPFDLLPDVLLIPHVAGQAKIGQSANGKIYLLRNRRAQPDKMSVRPRNRIFRHCYSMANREFHEKETFMTIHNWTVSTKINQFDFSCLTKPKLDWFRLAGSKIGLGNLPRITHDKLSAVH